MGSRNGTASASSKVVSGETANTERACTLIAQSVRVPHLDRMANERMAEVVSSGGGEGGKEASWSLSAPRKLGHAWDGTIERAAQS
jgi:hypothetical protein